MTKGVRKNRRVETDLPKRKVGRYLVLIAIMTPLAFQLKNAELQRYIPSFDMDMLTSAEATDEHVDATSTSNENAITSVIIEGDLHYTDKTQLEAAVIARLQDDFVRQDLKGIQQALLKDPWFKSVSVSRVWPSSLKITIEEQQPIARWSDRGFVNRYGEVIQVNGVSALSHLPVLEGDDDSAYDIAKEYLTMSRLMDDKQLHISALQVSAGGNWRLEMNSAFVVELGSKNISNRLSRFLYLYGAQLEQIKSEIARIDMRYPNGIAVSWKDTSSTRLALAADNNKFVSR